METTTQIIELGNLYPDLIEAIFCRVPIISLTRLKCVSKTWCNFITHLRYSTQYPTTSTGLVVFLKGIHMNLTLHESIFIKVHDPIQGQDCTHHLHSSFNHNFPWLIDSCNGLLLYATKDDNSWTYYISNPINLHQFIALPRAHHNASRSACVGLAFDESRQNQFNVICFFWEEVNIINGTVNCLVFLSQTWEWKEHQARILNSNLLLHEDFKSGDCFKPSVFSGGKLYWLWSLCILIYDVEREIFKLIQLPRNKSSKRISGSVYLSQFLWESEGKIHYCDPANDHQEFYIWSFFNDDDDGDVKGTDYILKWRFKKLIMIDGLWWSRLGKIAICPCAFNEDLQVLYLQLRGIILSYSFETQELRQVWSFDKPGENYFMCQVFPFLFNSPPILLSKS